MRGLKILTIAMAVMIVAGIVVVGVTILHRLSGPAGGPAFAAPAVLDEPAGSRIMSIAGVGERLAVQIQGGGPDRVVFIDARTGQVVGRAALAR
jgi:hypothetical protein